MATEKANARTNGGTPSRRSTTAGEMTQDGIARHLGVTEAAVSKWKRQLLEEGSQAWKATGRPPKLDDVAKADLVRKLGEGAIAAGFPTEQRTQERWNEKNS